MRDRRTKVAVGRGGPLGPTHIARVRLTRLHVHIGKGHRERTWVGRRPTLGQAVDRNGGCACPSPSAQLAAYRCQ
mgnify:CR=1 FL=1